LADEYDGVQARFYRQYFRGVEGDEAFYLDRARRAGGKVLELGCGDGRIALPLARAGIEVVGLERSQDMLEALERRLAAEEEAVRRRFRVVQGDMTDYDLEQEFSLVIAPYRAFQHLLTPVDQAQALVTARDHLVEGGALAFNTFDPQRDMAQQWLHGPGIWRQDSDFVDASTGNRVAVSYCRSFDVETQLMEQDLLFEESDTQGAVLAHNRGRLTLRYIFRHEMEYLLELCGFAVEELYGDFAGSPYPGWGEQVWVARRVDEA
jgi:SAM-dependent methyltransferase